MTNISTYWFKEYYYSIASGLVLLALFWLVSSFISRDVVTLYLWSAIGFLFGVLQSYVFTKLLRNSLTPNKMLRKKIILVGTLVIEFLLGVLLIGPFIWLQLRFIPTSNLHSICCETPLDYGAQHYENMRLTTEDGATIAGWYVPPTSQGDKVIILIHGYGYDRRGTDFQTRILIAAGYGVLLYDLRDHGESNGALNTFNRMQVYQADLFKVLQFLRQKNEVKHIGIVGISLGAFATLNSSPATLNSFSALWLDGLRFENFGSPVPIKQPVDHLKRIFDKQTRWLANHFYDKAIPAPTPSFREIIPIIHNPKLMLVASGLDESERNTNENLEYLMGNNKELWIIENAWHIGGRFEVPDEYRKKMLAFFDAAFKE